MLKLFMLLFAISFNIYAQDPENDFSYILDVDKSVEGKYGSIFADGPTPADVDVSYINKCTNFMSCDMKKFNNAINYVASVAMSTDYANNLHDKIKDLEANYKKLDEYKDIEFDSDKDKVREIMSKYIAYLKAVSEKQKLDNAEKRLPLLYKGEVKKQREEINKNRARIESELASSKKQLQVTLDQCDKVCDESAVINFFEKVSQDVKDVSYANKSGKDLYGVIKSQSLESCKKSSSDEDICKYVSSRQSLAFISGNDPSTQVVTKYTDKNCPLATRILQEQNVKPVLNTLCLGQMNKAYNNQMEKGISGIFDTLGHVNFVKNLCPEMAAQSSFIQKYTLSGSGSGLTGMPSSFDISGGTGAVVPNQNLLATNINAMSNWYNPMWSAASNNINTSNTVTGGGGVQTLKLSPSNTTSFYNALGSGYSKYSGQAGSFIPKATAQYNTISNYNNELSKNTLQYVENKTAYEGYTKAASDLESVAGGSSVTPEQVRLSITDLKAQDTVLMNDLSSILKDAYLIELKKKFGNVQEYVDAATAGSRASSIIVMHSILQQQIYGLESQLINYGGYAELFDIRNMYAQAGDDINIRKNDIKTPLNSNAVKYGLKPNWRANLKSLAKEMLIKADRAKKNANNYKSNVQKLLKKNVPLLSVSELPSLDMVGYEIKNMDAWKKAGIKNMKLIDKAIADNKIKRIAYDAKQMEALKSSMNYMVASIDKSAPSAQKAYSVLNDLYAEAPRTQELQAVAKKMVDQGL